VPGWSDVIDPALEIPRAGFAKFHQNSNPTGLEILGRRRLLFTLVNRSTFGHTGREQTSMEMMRVGAGFETCPYFSNANVHYANQSSYREWVIKFPAAA
jgi:hypothetical protein